MFPNCRLQTLANLAESRCWKLLLLKTNKKNWLLDEHYKTDHEHSWDLINSLIIHCKNNGIFGIFWAFRIYLFYFIFKMLRSFFKRCFLFDLLGWWFYDRMQTCDHLYPSLYVSEIVRVSDSVECIKRMINKDGKKKSLDCSTYSKGYL